MEGIPLKRFKRDLDDTETDIKKCIICRRAQAKHFQVLKLDGKILEAADIRQDQTSCNVTLQNDQRSTRSQMSPRAPPKNFNVDIYRKSCVICGHLKHKGDYEKFRISEEERARKFINPSNTKGGVGPTPRRFFLNNF